ncbi:MAG: ParB/RepB/Spo0J family partition protein [Spirochaetes bacterium]|jgi:ParB family chromosome partitioning protein|nr:ParB/RepB/Spo0J family partition protein [Spirochaetota bacterium]
MEDYRSVELETDAIIIRKRVRRNLGDLTPLAESIRKHGLLNPIVVTARHELVAGHRRLEAAKRLGWQTVPVRYVDSAEAADLVEMELDENIKRKNLTTDELAEAYMRIERLRNPGFLARIWRAIVAFFRRLLGRER